MPPASGSGSGAVSVLGKAWRTDGLLELPSRSGPAGGAEARMLPSLGSPERKCWGVPSLLHISPPGLGHSRSSLRFPKLPRLLYPQVQGTQESHVAHSSLGLSLERSLWGQKPWWGARREAPGNLMHHILQSRELGAGILPGCAKKELGQGGREQGTPRGTAGEARVLCVASKVLGIPGL